MSACVTCTTMSGQKDYFHFNHDQYFEEVAKKFAEAFKLSSHLNVTFVYECKAIEKYYRTLKELGMDKSNVSIHLIYRVCSKLADKKFEGQGFMDTYCWKCSQYWGRKQYRGLCANCFKTYKPPKKIEKWQNNSCMEDFAKRIPTFWKDIDEGQENFFKKVYGGDGKGLLNAGRGFRDRKTKVGYHGMWGRSLEILERQTKQWLQYISNQVLSQADTYNQIIYYKDYEIFDLQTQIEDLRIEMAAQKQSKNKELKELKDKVQALEKEKAQLKEKISQIEIKTVQSKKQIELKEDKIQESQTTIENLRLRIKHFEQQLKQKQNQIYKIKQGNTQLTNEKQSIEKEMAKQNQIIVELKQTVQKGNDKTKLDFKKLNTLENEKDNIAKEFLRVSKENSQKAAEINRLLDELEKYTKMSEKEFSERDLGAPSSTNPDPKEEPFWKDEGLDQEPWVLNFEKDEIFKKNKNKKKSAQNQKGEPPKDFDSEDNACDNFFSMLDKNKDHKISVDEYMSYLKQIGIKDSREEIEKIFAQYGDNGEMNIEAFRNFYNSEY